MTGAWHAVLRDIMIMLAAASVVVAAVFTILVAWQVYRIAKEFRGQVDPLVLSARQTAETVRSSAAFLAGGGVPRPAGAVGVASGAMHLFGLVRQLRRSRGGASPTEWEDLGGTT